MGDIRDKLESGNGPRLKYLVLDFKHVTFLDTSGARSFSRLAQLTENHGVSVVVTGYGRRIREQLDDNGFFTAPDAAGLVHRVQFSQLDEGVAWSENRTLDDLGISQANVAGSLKDWLAKLLEDEDAARRMAPFFEQHEHAAGDWLFRQGEPGGSLYVVESGTISVLIETAGGEEHFVRVYTTGAILGEMALYMEGARMASLRVETPSCC